MGIMRTKKQGVLKSSTVDKVEINDGHYIELLDRTHVVCEMIDTHLIKHPLATQDKEIKHQLEYALGQLYDAYQLIGSKIK
jgi:predicted RNA methylase